MDDYANSIKPTAADGAPSGYEIGYKRPPKHAQFPKGRTGNPKGRPKRPDGISLKELFDGVQRTKDGSTLSRRELMVRRILHDAMAGDPREFKKFIDLMERSGLIRRSTPKSIGPIIVKRVQAISSNVQVPQAHDRIS
ncbi:hypothetical protein IVB33_39595 [Bradyrhizobium sp. 24]|uniref:DUF5681 domain-containing protein n=1 Tax=unclassified Bradyrhizobium TaxID=2631580 RepID=UPI001FFC1AFD|nr:MULTISPECIES: DUF5681 domain-containing protein [unclassified Bradyrhizobium]MCK1303412.1 hypothetical protein [Bradyrhizobium sp. 37]MCK1382457.1 hypothetical protein [Bradyrhizobium sp. 24]MCK1770486.1 hypothetical protein [Bradyrhizobium sp. 134]UPJ44614.1 hypothetical protein IVB40_11610 [Bradyrhizobium sp. 40]